MRLANYILALPFEHEVFFVTLLKYSLESQRITIFETNDRLMITGAKAKP